MKKIIYKLAIVSLSMLTISCMDNNKNPYEPDNLIPDDYGTGAAMNGIASTIISSDVNTAQFTDALLGGPMGGYFADANAGWAFTISNYNPTDDWSRVLLASDEVIPVLNANYQAIENIGDPIALALGKIMKVATMHRVTDTYGPIPYTAMGNNPSDFSIPYDSQEEVFNAMFADLNDAIQVLNDNPTALMVPTSDLVYRGQTRQWVKFANSLKLRLAIRIAYANKTKAQQMAEEAVNPANGGVIEVNADNAAWHYFNVSSPNTLYTATRYNDVAGTDTGGDTHAAADIICYMNGYKDPRREYYFNRSLWPGTEYVGLRRGIIIPDHATIGYKYSGVKITPSSPALWMNAAEVAFLRAEGAAIFKFNMGGSAKGFYEEGIRLSFAQWGAEGAEAYINNETNIPANYVDPSGLNTYAGALSNIKIKWDENVSDELKQERIITQKWISNWQIGHEAWADFRRTGYPKLIPASDAGNKSGGRVDSAKGARRMPYPLNEYNNNAKNVEEAVSKYLKGPDNMATDVWWAAKK